MLKSEREGLVWLAEYNTGSTTREIAVRVGRSIRTVQHHMQRARQRWPDFSERIRVIMNGIVGECLHGLPVLRAKGEAIWVCADCAVTNDPDNRAFRRGKKIEKPKEPEKPLNALASVSEGKIVYETDRHS